MMTALLALTLLAASCGKEETEPAQPVEMSFDAFTFAGTKGIVDGTSLYDDIMGYRPLYVTAYLHSQAGGNAEYLCGDVFERQYSAWRHIPAVYWPMDGALDFIAYSASAPFLENDVIWGKGNTAERMRISVGNDRTQDDILFGSVWHGTSSGAATDMVMFHSQAWIEVTATLAAGALDLEVSLDRAVLTKTYIDGDLNVENNYGSPTYAWDFRRAEALDRDIDDPLSIFGTRVNNTVKRAWMLVPEQEMHQLEIYYTVDGVQYKVSYDLPHTVWVAGRKYTYSLVFDPVVRSSASLCEPAKARISLDVTDY